MTDTRLTVLFHSNTLTVRGTEVALFDYADFNEKCLGNRSVVAFPKSGVSSESALKKFQDRFDVVLYETQNELDTAAKSHGIDVCYFIKNGENDGLLVEGVKNVVHAVFQNYEPHGDVYAYVSDWLANAASQGVCPAVPHIIREPVNTSDDLRQELGIPSQADVYGVIGGTNSFKIFAAVNAVLDTIESDDTKYFVFVNTRMPEWFFWINRRIRKALRTGRLIYLEQIVDLDRKERFMNTCDAMLHARRRGESFGIALGEFAVRGKPVIVHFSDKTRDRCHYEILGNSANYYRSRAELRNLLSQPASDLIVSDAYFQFYPEKVMQIFSNVFLRPNTDPAIERATSE